MLAACSTCSPGAGPAPRERRAVAAPLLQLRPVPLGHAHEREDDARGQREGERGHEVERRGGVDRVEQVVHRRADPRLHRRDAPRRERARRGPAQARVGRRVEAHHRRLRPVAAGARGSRRASGTSGTSGSCAAAAERCRVEEHRLDVGVAGDDVVVERGRVEHRLLVDRQAAEHRVRDRRGTPGRAGRTPPGPGTAAAGSVAIPPPLA